MTTPSSDTPHLRARRMPEKSRRSEIGVLVMADSGDLWEVALTSDTTFGEHMAGGYWRRKPKLADPGLLYFKAGDGILFDNLRPQVITDLLHRVYLAAEWLEISRAGGYYLATYGDAVGRA